MLYNNSHFFGVFGLAIRVFAAIYTHKEETNGKNQEIKPEVDRKQAFILILIHYSIMKP